MVATKRSSNALLCIILAFLMIGSAAAILSTPTEGERGDTAIYGFVTEKGSNDTIENVEITITGNRYNESYTVYTNRDGYYEKAVEGNDNYTVTAEKSGYQSETESIYVEEGKEKRVDFELEKEGSGDDTIIKGYTKEKTNGTHIPQVFIKITKGEFNKTGSSNDNGSYQFELPEEGTYHIRAEKSGYKDYEVNVTVEGGKTTTHHILLERDESGDDTIIYGYVKDEDTGDPIERAEVSMKDGHGRSYSTTTNKDGYYDQEVVGDENYTIDAEAKDYMDSRKHAYVEEGQHKRVDFEMEKDDDNTTYLSGYTKDRDDHSKIANVDIVVRKEGFNASGESDGHGYYKIELPDGGEYTVRAWKDDYKDFVDDVEVKKGSDNDYDIEMEKEAGSNETIIYGRVEDKDTSDPIEDAEVFMKDGHGRSYSTTTNKDGYYDQEVVGNENYTIDAEADGYMDSRKHAYVEEGQHKRVDFHLEKDDGNKTYLSGYTKNRDNGEKIPHVDIIVSKDGFNASAESNDHGYYEMELPEGGEWTVRAWKDGYKDFVEDVDVKEGTNNDFDIEMESDGSGDKTILKGYTVEDDRGEHIPYVDIRIVKANYSKTTESNGDGYYEVELPEGGRYEIRAEKEGYKDYDGEKEVQEGKENTHHIYMEKEQSGNKTTIHGYTIDKDNETHIPHVYVFIHGGHFEAEEYSDKNGYYDFELPEGGNYTIEAEKDGYKDYEEWVHAEHEKNTTHHIQMESDGSGDKTILKGYTVEDNREEHIPYVDIRISRGNYSQTTESNGDGYYEVELPEGGRYEIRAVKEGYKDYDGEKEVQEGKENTHHIFMEEEQSGEKTTIHGYTIDKDNETHIPHVYVFIHGGHFEAEEYSDKNGYYDFELPEGGNYTIEAEKDGYKDYEEWVHAEHEKNTTHHIQMESDGSGDKTILKGYTLEDDRGDQIPFVDIKIWNHNWSEITESNAEGYYEVELPEGGRYEIHAAKEGYEDYDAEVEVQDGKVNNHHIYMEKEEDNRTILEGYVRDHDTHDLLKHVDILVYTTGHDDGTDTYTNENGYYYIERDYYLGNLTLVAEKEGYEGYETILYLDEGERNTHNFSLERDGDATILRGVVYDSETYDGIPEATVQITGQECNCSYTVTTNAHGVYEQEINYAGNYTVLAKRSGYEPTDATVYTPEGETTTLNLTLRKVHADTMPDLEVKNFEFHSTHPTEGDMVNITAIIRNRGDADAHNVTIVFYDNADGRLQVTLQIAEFEIPLIEAGGDYTATAAWDTTGQSGENIIWVVIDPFNTIEESKEDNNEKHREIEVKSSQNEYGVSVTTASYSIEFNDQRFKVITVSVENTGTVEDTYQITITGTHGGWKVTIDTPDTITLEAGEIRVLSVTIQEDVAEGGDNGEGDDGNRTRIHDGDTISVIITATSTTYPEISDSATIDGIIKLNEDDAIPDLTTPLIAVSIGAGAMVAFFRRRD